MNNGVLEIRHSAQEKQRQMLAFVSMASLILLINVFRDEESRALSLKIDLIFFAVAIVAIFFCINRQCIRVDSYGITEKRWFSSHQLAWTDIESYSLDWKKGFDDFLFSSYGLFNFQGKISLKTKTKRNAIQLKIDFGSRRQRIRLKRLILSYLKTSASSG